MIVVDVAISDENADWLKFLDSGEYQKADLLAHEEANKNLEASHPPTNTTRDG